MIAAERTSPGTGTAWRAMPASARQAPTASPLRPRGRNATSLAGHPSASAVRATLTPLPPGPAWASRARSTSPGRSSSSRIVRSMVRLGPAISTRLHRSPRAGGANRRRRPGAGETGSAAGLVQRFPDLGVVQLVLLDGHVAGRDLLLHRLSLESVYGLLDALASDVGRLLGDERLHEALLELLDLGGSGVEANHLDLAQLPGLAQPVGRALGREQVGREDSLQVRVLRQLGLDLRRGLVRPVVVELRAEIFDPRLPLDRLLETLLALVGGRDARLHVLDHDLPATADQLEQLLAGHAAAQDVVGRDLRLGDVRVFERGVHEDDLDAGLSRLLDRREHGLAVSRRDQDRVRLLRNDRVQHRGLRIRGELVRTSDLEIDAKPLRGLLRPASHRDVELVTLHALDERDAPALAATAAFVI